MDNWDPTVVYQMVSVEHRARLARGEQAQRLMTLLGRTSARTRLAAALVALAARLTPEPITLPEIWRATRPDATA